MIKQLLNYSYDVVKELSKINSFTNIKDNFLTIKEETLQADNKEIINMTTKQLLNKSTMNLYYSDLFIKIDNKIMPLLYCECSLKQEGKTILLEKEENQINIGAITQLYENNEEEEKIEYIINQLIEIDVNDIKKVLTGLLNLDKVEFVEQKTIFLSKMPESTAGLMKELKEIIKLY